MQEHVKETDRSNRCSVRDAVILFATITAASIFYSAQQSFPTSMTVLQKAFDLPKKLVVLNYISTLTVAVPFMLCPLLTQYIRSYRTFYVHMSCVSFLLQTLSLEISSCVKSVELLFISFTSICVLSSALFNSLLICIVADYFPTSHRYHVCATIGYTIGFPVAFLIFNPIMAVLVNALGWRNAWRLLGAMVLVIGIPLCFLLRPKPQATDDLFCSDERISTLDANGSADKSSITPANPQLLFLPWASLSRPAKVQLVMWMTVKFLTFGAWYGCKINLVAFLQWRGFSLQDSADAMMAYAAAQILATPLLALLDRHRCALLPVNMLLTVILGVVSALLASLHSSISYTVTILLIATYGGAVMGVVSLTFATSAELTGLDMVGVMSTAMMLGGCGILVSPLYSGLIVDETRSFVPFFYVQLGSYALQLFVLVAIFTISKVFITKHHMDKNYCEME